MSLNADFLLKVKDRVTSKLKSLGAFIDDELPDYIMVMVANNKSESSMAKDLQLFLGEHTGGFTKWLHTVLDDMKKDNEGKEMKSSDREKSEQRKGFRSRNSNARATDHLDSRRRSRSRSPMRALQREVVAWNSREPHGYTDALNLHPDEKDISSTGSVHEERKIVSTASLKRNKMDKTGDLPDLPGKASICSVVRVRNSSPLKHRSKVSRPTAVDITPSGLLLKKAFNDVKTNVEPPEIKNSGLVGRKPSHPIACPDVSSSSPDPASRRTKFYITLSGNKTAVSSTIISAESPPNPDRFQKRNMVGARSNVKSRLGSRKVLPYSRPEDERLSAKDRLGPVTHHSQLRLKSMTNPRFAMDAESTYEDLDEQVDMVEIVEGELEADEPDQSEDDKIHMDSDINDVDQRFVSASEEDSGVAMKSRLIDRINQRQLVVNLNETDEDDELSPSKGAGNKSVLQKPAIDTEQVHVPSSLDRCRFWPNCRNGKECPYIHPSEPCPTFPRCRFGATCIYIHPPCRFDAACTRPDCAFSHSAKRVLQKTATIVPPPVAASQIVCRYQTRCNNPSCPFYHPPAVSALPVTSPTTRPAVTALSTSPIPCRYGSACTNRAKCPFFHRDIPRPDQLKWVAPSKRSETTDSNKVIAAATNSGPVSYQVEAVK